MLSWFGWRFKGAGSGFLLLGVELVMIECLLGVKVVFKEVFKEVFMLSLVFIEVFMLSFKVEFNSFFGVPSDFEFTDVNIDFEPKLLKLDPE